MTREAVVDAPRFIPRSVIERMPARYSGLVEAYEDLREAHYSSREEVARRPMEEQDVTIEKYGYHIQDLTLETADRITQAVSYNPYGARPHYLEVGSGYWYHIGERRLVQRKWGVNRLRMTRPDFKNAPDAYPRDWYAHGMQIADKLIEKYSGFWVSELPRSLRRLSTL